MDHSRLAFFLPLEKNLRPRAGAREESPPQTSFGVVYGVSGVYFDGLSYESVHDDIASKRPIGSLLKRTAYTVSGVERATVEPADWATHVHPIDHALSKNVPYQAWAYRLFVVTVDSMVKDMQDSKRGSETEYYTFFAKLGHYMSEEPDGAPRIWVKLECRLTQARPMEGHSYAFRSAHVSEFAAKAGNEKFAENKIVLTVDEAHHSQFFDIFLAPHVHQQQQAETIWNI
jgi:hypothetical protein